MKTCPVKCPPLPCDVKCDYGHVLDKEGCPTCECIEPCKVSCFFPKENNINLGTEGGRKGWNEGGGGQDGE